MDTGYHIGKCSGNTVSHCQGVARSSWLPSGSGSPLSNPQKNLEKTTKAPQRSTLKLNASLNLNPSDILSCLRAAYAQLSSVEQQAVERYGLSDASQLLANQRALHLHCKVVKKNLAQAATLAKRLTEHSSAPQLNAQQKDIENAGSC